MKKNLVISNPGGLHMRPAGQLCAKALEYECKVQMVIGERTYNLKSMLSVLSAQVTSSREIELVCEGRDEENALEEMAGFLSGFIEA